MSQRSRPLVVSLLPLMLAVVPGRAHAAPHLTGRAIVRQGTTEFTIAPLRGSRSVAAFYSYDFPASSCANTGLETTSTSLLFLYEDTTVFPRSLGLVVIHDLPGNPAGGYAEFAFSGLPAASRYVVQDDSDGPYTPDPPAGGQTDATWSWSPCCTDGAAFDGLDTAPFCIAIQPTFTSGIASWQVLDGPDTFTPNRIPLPTLTDTTWICGDCQNLVCPGRVLVGCASGGIAHADVVAVATSLCGGEIVSNDRTAGGADASGDYPVGTTTVTFTLKDAAGFMSTCTTDVVVQDGTPLVVAACRSPIRASRRG